MADSGVPSFSVCVKGLSNYFPTDILVKNGYSREAQVVSAEADFGNALQRDLASLVAS